MTNMAILKTRQDANALNKKNLECEHTGSVHYLALVNLSFYCKVVQLCKFILQYQV